MLIVLRGFHGYHFQLLVDTLARFVSKLIRDTPARFVSKHFYSYGNVRIPAFYSSSEHHSGSLMISFYYIFQGKLGGSSSTSYYCYNLIINIEYVFELSIEAWVVQNILGSRPSFYSWYLLRFYLTVL